MSISTKVKVAVIDGGGRGAALVRAYARSEHVGTILAIPGNDMMKMNSEKPVLTFPSTSAVSKKEIVAICASNRVALVDVAQDNAIEAGLVDALRNAGIPTIGPTRAAGEIEWNKVFSRELGNLNGLPQPRYDVFHSEAKGIAHILNQPELPIFIKA